MNVTIILGLELNDDGTMKQELIDRLDLGLKSFKNSDSDLLLVTGGKGNPKAPYTEGDLMYDYLVSKGFDESKLMKEISSATTVENAVFTKDMLANKQIEKVYVVSTKYHFFRTNHETAGSIFRRIYDSSEIVEVYED